ncbi:MAG: protein-glutamate O-methyltransferase CheR [Desulfovibrionaceae bacterium]|nr:protein-glutamate O-methyltransferase CheR [Desulfovibrionaceae bacterium]MBF0514492.1 protein-glutamate O-methyltransferase CheR [Desulfovibrionaceae bacterium]
MGAITKEEFEAVCAYVYGLTGISLDNTKAYLVETRLGSLVKELGLSGYGALLAKAKAEAAKHLEKKIIDAITTNETLFFRDSAPFELLREKILPEVAGRGKKSAPGKPPPIRIWSAACSTGQEIYSIAITAKEVLGVNGCDIRLIGSDISEAAMNAAREAVYSKFEIDRGMPGHLVDKYFAPRGHKWQLHPAVKSMAEFRKVNLMGPLEAMGKFDVIFCRNVAIYFSQADKAKLFERLAKCLVKDGYLIIGSTESLRGVCPAFELKMHGRAAYYQIKD